MWREIAGKEIRGNLLNGRMAAVLVVAGGLFVALGILGARNYNHQRDDYEARVAAHREELSAYTTLHHLDSLGIYVDRPPAPLSSMVRGAEGSYGNILRLVRLTYPQYSGGSSDSPLMTAFEPVDFLFVIKIVLSLCALLLTFDAVSGERENGTLALVLAGLVSRFDLLAGKLLGAFVSLVLPSTIAFAAGVAIVALQLQDGLTPSAWLRIAAVWGVAVVYLTIFLCIGLLASSAARASLVSLTIALLAWLTLVIVLPRVLVATAGHVASPPDIGQVEAEIETIRQVARLSTLRKLHYLVESTGQQLAVDTIYLVNRGEAHANMTRVHELREAYERRRGTHDRVVRGLMTIGPAGALSGGAMMLAGTEVANYARYLDHFKQYREGILRHYAQFPKRNMRFDAAALPAFRPPQPSLAETASTMSLQAVSLVVWLVFTLGAGAIALSRYDPR